MSPTPAVACDLHAVVDRATDREAAVLLAELEALLPRVRDISVRAGRIIAAHDRQVHHVGPLLDERYGDDQPAAVDDGLVALIAEATGGPAVEILLREIVDLLDPDALVTAARQEPTR